MNRQPSCSTPSIRPAPRRRACRTWPDSRRSRARHPGVIPPPGAQAPGSKTENPVNRARHSPAPFEGASSHSAGASALGGLRSVNAIPRQPARLDALVDTGLGADLAAGRGAIQNRHHAAPPALFRDGSERACNSRRRRRHFGRRGLRNHRRGGPPEPGDMILLGVRTLEGFGVAIGNIGHRFVAQTTIVA